MKKKGIVRKGIISRLQAIALLALCCFVVQFSSATPAFADAKLFTAIEAGDMAAFRAALDAGANVNGRDMNMKPVMASTPLMVACRTGQFDMARELVERGADINAQTGVGATAFLLAAEHPGTSEFLQYLQGKGANIHWSMDAFGGALELAALQNPDIKVFRTLLDMGLDKDMGGESCIDRCFIAAVRGNPNPEVIKLFVGMGANVQARDDVDNALAWEGSEIEEKPERLEWLKKNTDLPIPAQAQKRRYSYRSEGAVGTLELRTKDNDGKYNISIHTTNESNLRMCEFDGNCVRTDSGLTCDNPESGVPELRLTIQELKNGELEVSVNLPEFKVCGMGPGIAGRYVPKRNGNAAQTTPAASQQQGRKEVKGTILKEVPYKDSRGNNVVILSRSDRDGDTRSSDLYAYGYANDGASPSLSWKLYDYFHECPVDLTADFSEQSPIITDLDKNGISEVWLVYYIGCRGDVSPDSMKIIMYEGSKKYALRGETVCPTGDGKYMGGKYTADPAFKDAPPEFRRYADKLWQKNKKRF